MRHEKLRSEALSLVWSNYFKGLEQYINGHMKVRRKMIHAKVSLVTDDSGKKTVRLILLGLVNHSAYGMAAERIFSTEL